MATLFDDETRAVEHNSRLSENYRVIFGNNGNESGKRERKEPSDSVSRGERDETENKTRNEEIKKVLSANAGYNLNGADYFSYNPYRNHTINQEEPIERSSSARGAEAVRPAVGTSPSHSYIRTEGNVRPEENVRASEIIEERLDPDMPKSLRPTRGRSFNYASTSEEKEPISPARVDVYPEGIRPNVRWSHEGTESLHKDGDNVVSKTSEKNPVRSAPSVKEQPKNDEGEVGRFLSTQAKVIVAVFVAVVMIAFTVIFVNSALLNSLDGELAEKETLMAQVSQEADSYLAQIKEATDKDTIVTYAQEAGMIFE